MIEIDKDKCVGCGQCVEICPGNLLALKNSRADIRDVRDCWGCTACVKTCPRQAIAYRLSAELGGAGAKLFAEDKKQTLTWRIEFPNGTTKQIVVEKRQANKF